MVSTITSQQVAMCTVSVTSIRFPRSVPESVSCVDTAFEAPRFFRVWKLGHQHLFFPAVLFELLGLVQDTQLAAIHPRGSLHCTHWNTQIQHYHTKSLSSLYCLYFTHPSLCFNPTLSVPFFFFLSQLLSLPLVSAMVVDITEITAYPVSPPSLLWDKHRLRLLGLENTG